MDGNGDVPLGRHQLDSLGSLFASLVADLGFKPWIVWEVARWKKYTPHKNRMGLAVNLWGRS